MRVKVAGQSVYLGKNAFVGQGGEGSVYAKDDVAFKIYSDPKKMIPLAKIQELSALKLDNIIKPLEVVTANRKPIGYTMRFLKGTYPLCQLFTRSFRTRYGITPDVVLHLVQGIEDVVQHVHDNGILVVDLNEMNFLVSKDFASPYAIDVDSYQTPSFSATAIMESIRDRQCGNNFTEGSDWFSFAVVSFQLFVGIHPYRGKHPDVKELDGRMKNNLSVLNRDVRVPKACQDFSVIPNKFMDWYVLVLEKGERVPPPSGVEAGRSIVITKVAGSDNFVITIVKEYDGEVLDYVHVGGRDIALGQKPDGKEYWYHDGRNYDPATLKKLNLAIVPKSKDIVQAWTKDGNLLVYNMTKGQVVDSLLEAEEVMTHEGVLYAKNKADLLEIELPVIGGKITPVSRIVAGVMPNATKMFPGVAMQNMLGAAYSFLLPRLGTCFQVRMNELDGYRIIDAKLDRNVLLVIGFKKGMYDRFIFRFDDDFGGYDTRKTDDVGYHGVNFIALDTGVCVMINENEEVGMFSARKDSKTFKIIDDPAVDATMRLYKKGAKVLFAKGKTLYALKAK